MRAIQVTCPNCGARLQVGNADVVRCEYCGGESRVQRRTRVFERVKPPPEAKNRPLQIAVQTKTKAAVWIAVIAIGVPLLASAFAIYFAVSKQLEARDRAKQVTKAARARNEAVKSAYVPPENRPPTWQGMNTPLLVDADKDGTADIVGRARQVHRGDVIHVMAIDGSTGKQKWLSEPVGTYTETYRNPLALAGDLLLFSTDRGDVHGLDAATGKRTWKVTLPERVAYFCTASSEIAVVTQDDMRRTLSRADGSLGAPVAVPKRKGHPREHDESGCVRLPTDRGMLPPMRGRHGSVDAALLKKLDVYADQLVEGPGGRVLGATPNKGTRVTTLIALDDKNNERWRVRAAGESLAGEGPPRHLAVGSSHVCAVYDEGRAKVACFALADGKRLWVGDSPSFMVGLAITGSSLIITTGGLGIESRDVATGAMRWKFQ